MCGLQVDVYDGTAAFLRELQLDKDALTKVGPSLLPRLLTRHVPVFHAHCTHSTLFWNLQGGKKFCCELHELGPANLPGLWSLFESYLTHLQPKTSS